MVICSGDPGATKTDNVNQMGAVGKFLAGYLADFLMKPVQEGASLFLQLAIKAHEGIENGMVYQHGFKKHELPKSILAVDSKATWETLERELKLDPLKL